jgi:hypothetical protein
MSFNKLNDKLKKKDKISMNSLIEKKIDYKDINAEIDYSDNEIELEKLEKELILKSKINTIEYPKNYGNIWKDEERDKIIKYLKKNNISENSNIFDDTIINDLANILERTEHGVKEEIKKMIFNDFMNGYDYNKLSKKFNFLETNIKLIIKMYIEKNGKKIINSLEFENKLLKYKIENIKLKKELEELNKL